MTTRELTPLEAELLAALKLAADGWRACMGTRDPREWPEGIKAAQTVIARAETPPKGGE